MTFKIKKNRTAENDFSQVYIKDTDFKIYYSFYWTCPLCGTDNIHNLEKDAGLNYPELNGINHQKINCSNCDFKGKAQYELKIKFEPKQIIQIGG